MSVKPWGARTLTDEVIRKIAREGRAAPHGSRRAIYLSLAKKYGCGASTVGKIVNVWILPKQADSPSHEHR
jgi:hypothetical protein